MYTIWNTTKKTYDLKSIMARAWEIRESAAAEIGCKGSEIIWSLCLKMAWAEAEGTNAQSNAYQIIREWNELGENGQVKLIAACIRVAAKNEIGYGTGNRYLQISETLAFGGFYLHDFDEIVSEVCIRVLDKLDNVDNLTAMNERRATEGKRPLRLTAIVCRAARASIAAIYYQDRKHSVAYDWEIDDGEGITASYLETMIVSGRDNTEQSAIIRSTLDKYRETLDRTGQIILELVALEMTERQIAKAVSISNVAVHNRIVKMRAALESLRTA